MNDRHEGFSHAAGIRVLDNVPAVDQPGSTLGNELLRTMEYFQIIGLPSTADQDRYPCGLNYLMINVRVVGRIGLDHVRT